MRRSCASEPADCGYRDIEHGSLDCTIMPDRSTLTAKGRFSTALGRSQAVLAHRTASVNLHSKSLTTRNLKVLSRGAVTERCREIAFALSNPRFSASGDNRASRVKVHSGFCHLALPSSVKSTSSMVLSPQRGQEGVKKCWGQPAAAKWFTDKQGLGNSRLWQSPIFSHLPDDWLLEVRALRPESEPMGSH